MNVIKRVVAAAVLGFTLSGCATITGTSSPTSGRVTGHVTVRACGGANTENQNGCKAQPAPGVTLTFTEKATTRLTRVSTDATGAYSVTLSPGSYEVKPQFSQSPGLPRDGQTGQVTVVAGKTVTANFSYTIQLL